MRTKTRFLIALLTTLIFSPLSQPCFPQAVHFRLLNAEVIEARLRQVRYDNKNRKDTISGLFAEVGCSSDQLVDQAVKNSKLPNVVCTLPGTTDSVVIVGGHYDMAEMGKGAECGSRQLISIMWLQAIRLRTEGNRS